jgi:rod shape-determining protein MreD
MELAGIGPHWPLMWVVTWSMRRTAWQGMLAGLILGLLQDGMSGPDPTHVLSLAIVGMLTARLQKQRFTQEDFISVALTAFVMAAIAETIIAIQLSLQTGAVFNPIHYNILGEIWTHQQQVALASAILTSLWAPVIHYPLSRWWHWMSDLEHPPIF